MKNRFAICIFLVCVLSGCGTFRTSTTQVRNYSVTELDRIISQYEKVGTTPKHDDIGEIYAMRSACHAHHNPTFKATVTCVGLGWEGGLRHGIPFLLASPLAVVFDVCALPVQAVRTLGVSDAEMHAALHDLETARKLGYSRDRILVHYYVRDSTHLDRLGYKIEDYTEENPEQSPAGDRLKAPPEE